MSHDNLVGQVLGQYELRELLGLGGMGAVYRGFQISLKREVAVKVLPSSLVNEPGYVERFNREAQTAALLEHPHIVSIFDYGTQQGTSYLVMRLLSGGTLAQRLNQRNDSGNLVLPSLGETATLVSQLSSALAYAHNQGVIHRDIKTSNVMFDNQGNGYLVDFGIAKLMGAQSGLTGTGMAMGTPAYMPPEQWAGRDLTPAADQYALAVLVYAMITGRVPFEAATPYELLHKHLHEQPTPPHSFRADLPQAVDLVLARALSKEPEERFASVTAFAIAFDSAIEGSKGEATAFFTTKIPMRTVRAPVLPGFTPTPNLTPNLTPSRMHAGSSQPSVAAPLPSQPVAITQQTPIYKNPIAYGILVVIVLLGVILGVLLSGNNNNTVVANLTPTQDATLEFIASDTPPAPSETPGATETQAPATTEAPAATETQLPATTEAPAATETQIPATTVAPATTEAPPATTQAPTLTIAPVEINLLISELAFDAENSVISLNYTDSGATQIDRYELEITSADNVVIAEREFIPSSTGIINLSIDSLPAGEYVANLTAIDASGQTLESVQTSLTIAPEPTESVLAATETPAPSDTPTETLAPTDTATPSATEEPTSTPTETALPTGTHTPEPTATHTDLPTETPTSTPTETPLPTETPTPTETATPTEVPINYDPLEIAFHSNMRSGSNDIYLMDRDGNNIVQITHSTASQSNPSWSPDGMQIAYIDSETGSFEVWKMNRDGSGAVQLTNNGQTADSPAWSPDGQYIAYVLYSEDTSSSDIFVMRTDGSSVTRLTDSSSFELEPAWSPDGTKIAFTTSRNGNSDIAVMDYDGGNQRVLTTDPGPDFQPDWFPDGTKIIYQSYVTGYDLHSVNLDGSGIEQLTHTADWEEAYPAVSPDGNFVIFESLRVPGNVFYDLWLLNLSDESIVQLTNDTDDSSVSWRRDPAAQAAIQPLPEIISALSRATSTPTATVFMSIGTRPVLVYDGASEQATSLNVTGARVPVTGVTPSGEWYRIEIRGRNGWVKRNSSGYRLEGNISTLPIAESGTQTDDNGSSGGETYRSNPGFLHIMAGSEFESELETITSAGWEIALIDNQGALCSTGTDLGSLLTFGLSEWRNYEVSAEVQYRSSVNGEFTIITRMSDDGTGVRHRMNGDNGMISQFTYRSTGESLGMGSFEVNIRPAQWAILRAEVDGTKIRTFFDGLLISEFDLLGGNYSNGYIGLEASVGTRICINRLWVRSLERTADTMSRAVTMGDVLTSANLRLFPGAGFSRVGAASTGQQVYLLERNDSGWYYVRVDRPRNPFEGWVTSEAISLRE